MIRSVQLSDAPAICDIYNYYILNSTVTFEENPVSTSEMQERINDVIAKYPWLVYEENGTIIGYAYASPWKARSAYRFSVETTVYIASGNAGKGLGSELYQALFNDLEKKGVHAIIGGIALPNDGCIALHKKFGFEKVAHFKEVGFKFNKWIDVTYWEIILNIN